MVVKGLECHLLAVSRNEWALYHVLPRGGERQDIFLGDDDRRLCLATLTNRFNTGITKASICPPGY